VYEDPAAEENGEELYEAEPTSRSSAEQMYEEPPVQEEALYQSPDETGGERMRVNEVRGEEQDMPFAESL
jgi:hypothetical protein